MPGTTTGLQLPADLKSLTAFRFFAAFWVFLFHLRSRIDHDDTWFWAVIDNGARGVDFFFILSGFVIFHVYEPQIVAGRFSFWRYMIKRFARIYPLHLAVLCIFLLLAVAGGNEVHNLIPSIFLLHAWGITEGLVLNRPSWTLSAEMFAYLVFGVLVMRRPATWMLVVACIVTAVAVHFVALKAGKTAFLHMTWDYGSLRIIPLFILGMLLRRLCPAVPKPIAAGMGVLGLVGLLWTAGAGMMGYEILVPFMMLIVAGARLSDQSGLPTNTKPMVYLGEISYSIYLIHILVIQIFLDYLPALGVPVTPWPVIGLALIAGSALTYHLIEVPARRWINQKAAGV